MSIEDQLRIEPPLWSRNFGEDEDDGFDGGAPRDPNAPAPAPVIPHAKPVLTWAPGRAPTAPAAAGQVVALATPLLLVAANPLAVAALCASVTAPLDDGKAAATAVAPAAAGSGAAAGGKAALKDPAPFVCIGTISVNDEAPKPAPAAAARDAKQPAGAASASKLSAATNANASANSANSSYTSAPAAASAMLFAHTAGVYSAKLGAVEAVLVLLHTPLPAERAFAWTEVLLSHVSAQRVLVLDTMADAAYQPPLLHAYFSPTKVKSKANVAAGATPAHDAETALHGGMHARPSPPLLRSVVTTAAAAAAAATGSGAAGATGVALCPRLEVPNIATGLAAAVMAQCEVSGVRAELYLSLYSAHFVFESLSAFEGVFGAAHPTALNAVAPAFAQLSAKGKRAVYDRWCRAYRLPVATADRLASSMYL